MTRLRLFFGVLYAMTIALACTLVWEVRVIGWDVCYGVEFVPGFEASRLGKVGKLCSHLTTKPQRRRSYSTGPRPSLLLIKELKN
ncbi:Patellin-5 [Camellia lanceoleosa]|uniref:Patellin-5 n=1 Tax=Camellia lanceoleosa TaxID=1840588 RepID=A0ACC0HI88_9ERIC|nr:Patellin-5 [Camellia lanceoleosa]